MAVPECWYESVVVYGDGSTGSVQLHQVSLSESDEQGVMKDPTPIFHLYHLYLPPALGESEEAQPELGGRSSGRIMLDGMQESCYLYAGQGYARFEHAFEAWEWDGRPTWTQPEESMWWRRIMDDEPIA